MARQTKLRQVRDESCRGCFYHSQWLCKESTAYLFSVFNCMDTVFNYMDTFHNCVIWAGLGSLTARGAT